MCVWTVLPGSGQLTMMIQVLWRNVRLWIDALCATLPVDPEKLEKVELWSQWDFEGTGHITREAFEHPRGMLQFVLYSLPSLKREVRSGAIPDVEQNRESWFRYWDEDNQRELEFLVCLRALARTLRIDGDCADMSLLRKVLIQLFMDFGLCEEMNMDYSTGAWSVQGIDSRPLTQKLFCERPDGFCDRLLDQLKQEFGRSRFCQLQERARLLQLPVAELKRHLPRSAGFPVPLEKGELVEAILAAPNCARPPKAAEAFEEPQSTRQWHAGLTQQEVQALPLAELQRRLRSVGVSYDHCLERRELEELLLGSKITFPSHWGRSHTRALRPLLCSMQLALTLHIPERCWRFNCKTFNLPDMQYCCASFGAKTARLFGSLLLRSDQAWGLDWRKKAHSTYTRI